jgi:ribosomal protein L7Ae-like RNA K-turn-binding protein
LLAARRIRALAIGAHAATRALARTDASTLAVVAVDAGSIATSGAVEQAARDGRAIAWKTKSELGALLGEETVAICAVCHAGIAGELKTLRAAADAGAAATREGAGCSRRPEAR